jgi:hypothetical protein
MVYTDSADVASISRKTLSDESFANRCDVGCRDCAPYVGRFRRAADKWIWFTWGKPYRSAGNMADGVAVVVLHHMVDATAC